MDKYETLRNSVVWAVTHYGIVNTEGIIERLRETVLELDSEQLQKTLSNSKYMSALEVIITEGVENGYAVQEIVLAVQRLNQRS